MGSFCLQDIEFLELLLVILLSIIRLVSLCIPCLKDFPLPWVVTIIFTMEATIKWGFLATFLTAVLAFLSLLGTFFVFHGVAVLVRGRNIGHGNVIRGLILFTVSYEGWKVYRFWIKTLRDYHCLVASRSFFARESTSSDSSDCWLSLKRGAICTFLELWSWTNPTYCLVVSFWGFSIF